MRGRQRLWLEVAVLLAVAVGCVAAAEKKTGAEGTCDADAKGVIAAGKKLSEELEAMKKVDSLGAIADVSRTWRLVRNQQQQVEESFVELNTRFSSAIRKLSGIKTIKTDDKSKVEALFLGGEPFFVQCASPIDQLHRTFMDSALGLSDKGVTPAVIDCNGKLPSGKTVMERFFAGKTLEEPIFFVVSNRQPPRPFSIKSHVTPEMLINFASNVTAVKVTRVTDADEFKEGCLRRKQCALVIFDGNYTEGEAAATKAAAVRHRGIAVAEMDTRKLRLSIEDALPASKGEPRLVFLSLDTSKEDPKKKDDKKGTKKKETKFQGKAFKGKWDDKEIGEFLATVSKSNAKLAKLKTHPQVFDRKEEEKAARKAAAKKKEKDTSEKKTKKNDSPYDHVDEKGSKKSSPPKPGGHRASTATKTSSGAKGGKNKVQVDKKGRQRKSWSPDEQIKAEQEERDRERRRREEMMAEAETADGIEFVGEDVSEVDLEDDDGRPRRDPLDEDEDEEELEEIVVDDDEASSNTDDDDSESAKGGVGEKQDDADDDDQEEEKREEEKREKTRGKKKGDREGHGEKGWFW